MNSEEWSMKCMKGSSLFPVEVKQVRSARITVRTGAFL